MSEGVVLLSLLGVLEARRTRVETGAKHHSSDRLRGSLRSVDTQTPNLYTLYTSTRLKPTHSKTPKLPATKVTPSLR